MERVLLLHNDTESRPLMFDMTELCNKYPRLLEDLKESHGCIYGLNDNEYESHVSDLVIDISYIVYHLATGNRGLRPCDLLYFPEGEEEYIFEYMSENSFRIVQSNPVAIEEFDVFVYNAYAS